MLSFFITAALLLSQTTDKCVATIDEIKISLNEFNRCYYAHNKGFYNVKTNEEIDRLEKLAFVEIQQLMIQTLSSYCGLMARPLIQQIQQVKTIPELKVCQMQWITSLQESRIPPIQLNQTLKLINYSVEHL